MKSLKLVVLVVISLFSLISCNNNDDLINEVELKKSDNNKLKINKPKELPKLINECIMFENEDNIISVDCGNNWVMNKDFNYLNNSWDFVNRNNGFDINDDCILEFYSNNRNIIYVELIEPNNEDFEIIYINDDELKFGVKYIGENQEYRCDYMYSYVFKFNVISVL